MHRFCFPDIVFEKNISIENVELYHQICKVLRAREGATYIFFDGKTALDYEYRLEKIGKKDLAFSLVKKIEKDKFEKKIVRLYQGMPSKMEKIEYIVQKWIEVWITQFIFFRSQWSQKLFLSESKNHRIQKIAQEAVEQSGRNIVPKIEFYEKPPQNFLGDQKIIFHHIPGGDSQNLGDVQFSDDISIFVWPEWGWSEEEITKFTIAWCRKVFFGNAVLRCETVGGVIWFYIHHR